MGVFCHYCLALCLALWSHLINMREGKLALILVGNTEISLNFILLLITKFGIFHILLFIASVSLRENRSPVPPSAHGGYIKVVTGFIEHLHFDKCHICNGLFHPLNNLMRLVSLPPMEMEAQSCLCNLEVVGLGFQYRCVT